MTNPVLDPINDKNKSGLFKVAEAFELPDFVKTANMDATLHPVNIAKTAFADFPSSLRYPCHTAAATWMSTAYFQLKKASFNTAEQKRIKDNLQKAAAYFGIRPACDKVLSHEVYVEKMADSDYAYVYQSDTGDVERHFPITNAEEIKVAADWLEENQQHFIFEDRCIVAEKILRKAASVGVRLGDELASKLEKQAGYGLPDLTLVQLALSNRALLTRDSKHRASIEKLAEEIKEKPELFLSRETSLKLASAIDQLDHAIGLNGKYTALIPSPEDIVFTVSLVKAAAACGDMCELQTGNVYEKDQLAKLARQDLVEIFGDDFAKEACVGLAVDPEKLATIAHTLPKPDAELLEKLLKEAGQSPARFKVASSPLDEMDLDSIAASY